jgi:hypothetical protein
MSITVTLSGATKAEVLAAAVEYFGLAAADVSEAATTSRSRSNGKGKATDDAKEKGGDDAPTGPTVEEIRELAGKIESDDDQDKAIAVISDAGAESISGLEKKSAKVRQSVYDSIKEIVEKAAAKGKRKALD